MKRWGEQKETHFDERELKTDLGTGNFIFVGSSCDMWARDVPDIWIVKTIEYALGFKNKYLFQTKNPNRYFDFRIYYPGNITIGTTIETNRIYPQMGHTPPPHERAKYLNRLFGKVPVMVTIEPIMNFDLGVLAGLVRLCQPEWVNIGADSGGHKLPEPSLRKVKDLISELMKFTEVKIKKNLKRIIGG